MPNFVEAMTGFMKSNFCAALNVLGDAITLGSELVPGPAGFLNVPNALGALVCDYPPDNLVAPEPPFTGGQCYGGLYSYDFVFTNDQGQRQTIPQQVNARLIGTFVGDTQPNQTRPTGVRVQTSPTAPITEQTFANVASAVNPAPTIQNVVRLTGGPDNCGDPPAPFPEPSDDYEFGGDITYNIDGDTTITVPVTAVFAPIFVDIDGSLRVPVNVDVGGLQFTGNLEVSPSFTLNLKPGGIKTGPGKPDDPDLGPGQPGVPVPEDEEDADVIVGVLVFSTLQSDENPATGFPAVGGPTFLVPRVGSVQFAIKTGNSIGWTSDIDIKNLECYVPCPAPQGAIAVRVTPVTGVTRTFTPVRGKPLTSF